MESVITTILVFCVALMMPGIINRTRALLAGRRGVRFFQHIDNVRVMAGKGVVTGHTSTILTKIAPSIYLGSVITAALFIPLAGLEPILHFRGDIVAVAYLLALGRFILILAAMDTGSSFEGMGASREALYGAMLEPALFIAAGTLALISGNSDLYGFYQGLAAGRFSPEIIIVLVLVSYVIFRVMTVECGRMPVDDPRTHLELTMIHEVMVLDYSGIDLAMITVAGWLKLAVFSTLAGTTVAAAFSAYPLMVPLSLVFIVLAGVATGFVESFTGRNKLSRNTTYIFTIVSIAFVLFMVAYLLQQDIGFK